MDRNARMGRIAGTPWRDRRAIVESERRYRQMFERNPRPLLVHDEATLRILAVNDRAVELYGYTREELLEMTIDAIDPRIAAGGELRRHRRKGGQLIHVEVATDAIELDGRPALLLSPTDVSDRVAAERRLRYHADHDALTGLWTRRRLEHELDSLLDHGSECALVLFDIDHFKLLNDSFGHARGDAVLRAVAAVLDGQRCRGQHLGRLGGDEFALLLPGTRSVAARVVAKRALLALKQDVHEGDRPVTASAGVASSGDGHGASGDELLHAADIALYKAKDRGRDRCAVASRLLTAHPYHSQHPPQPQRRLVAPS
jgi:diguanylate cyclase (GGDEF)-like protein